MYLTHSFNKEKYSFLLSFHKVKLMLSNIEGMSNGPSFHSFFHVCILFLVRFSFLAYPILLPFYCILSFIYT